MRGRPRITDSTSQLEAVNEYIYLGFDALDAEHLAIATHQLKADVFVTKDRDFHEREK